jgi:hypothetical protein
VFNSGHAVNLVQNIADSEGRGRDVEEAIDLTGVGSENSGRIAASHDQSLTFWGTLH